MNKQELIESIAHLPSDCSRPRPMIDKLTALELIKLLEEPQPIKLKDVIVRIKQLDIGTRKVWLDEFLNKLGSDYGLLKYKLGYEQGKFEASMIPCDEPQKPVVPQFIADWIEKVGGKLFGLNYDSVPSEIYDWVYGEEGDLNKLHLACAIGYTVEKEKRYKVKIKASGQYIIRDPDEDAIYFYSSKAYSKLTKKELEQAGFGWVFDCEGIEIEEVAE